MGVVNLRHGRKKIRSGVSRWPMQSGICERQLRVEIDQFWEVQGLRVTSIHDVEMLPLDVPFGCSLRNVGMFAPIGLFGMFFSFSDAPPKWQSCHLLPKAKLVA